MGTHQVLTPGSWSVARLGRFRAGEDAMLTLRCGGRVWVTRDGDPDDHVLHVGDTLALRRGDRLLIEPWTVGAAAWLSCTPTAAVRRHVSSVLAAIAADSAAHAKGWMVRLRDLAAGTRRPVHGIRC